MRSETELPGCPEAFSALCLIAALGVGTAYAADYHVGAGQTYATLEALRTTPGITWADDDRIILHGDDTSLTGQFEFGGASVTISGSGVIKKAMANQRYRFATGTGTITVESVSGAELRIEGFGGQYFSDSGGAILGATTIRSGMNVFSGNSTNGNGGAILGATTISGGENVFSGNSITSGFGGAIFGTTTISGGENVFSGNSARSSGGGAISGATTISDGENVFSGNSARDGGAIEGTTTISGGANVFSGNSARDGGAIEGTTTISGGANVFSGNSAGSNGGAIDGATTISGGENVFSENSATGNGGAIRTIAGWINLSGNTLFKDNTAGMGGAIFADRSVNEMTFSAVGGDIAFSGNKASGVANSIYLAGRNPLVLAGPGNVYFDDPISTGTTGGNWLKKDGSGFVPVSRRQHAERHHRHRGPGRGRGRHLTFGRRRHLDQQRLRRLVRHPIRRYPGRQRHAHLQPGNPDSRYAFA